MRYQILNSFRLNAGAVRDLVAEVPENRMCEQADGIVNHAAWTLGHMVSSLQAIGVELGLKTWLPETWTETFGQGSTPVSDAAAYPSKADLVAAFEDAETRITDRLQAMTPAHFADPLPDARHRERLPTVGHAATHILCAHLALHLGQLTAWQRAIGLAPATAS